VSPARLRLGCSTAEDLILAAYVVYPGGAPLPRGVNVVDALFRRRGIGSERSSLAPFYAVHNRGYDQGPARVEEMRGQLMQDLLKERFRVRMHEESRPMAVYELAQDKGGARLKPAQPGSCFEMDATKTPPAAHGGKAPPPICGGFRRSEAEGVDAYHATIATICRAVSNGLNRPLVDKTGLTAFMMCIWS
jgi:hypothetical protein